MIHVIPGTSTIIVVETSSIYAVPPELVASGEFDFSDFAGLPQPAAPPQIALEPHPRAISLNIAQSCNLGCSYCYADEGRFGGRARLMPAGVAYRAIQQLFEKTAGNPVTIGFIGGEPLLNRAVLHESVEFAAQLSRERRIPVTFGITTNATLLEQSDLELFRKYSFAVTVSLDGPERVNDAHRRSRDGKSSFDAATGRIAPLLKQPGGARVAARATITRENLDVSARVDALADAGFTEIGVSPLRASPDPELRFRDDDWSEFLFEMKRAAAAEWNRVSAGAGFRFSNLAIALKQLHRGSCKPLPCGAGAGYVSLSAEGEYYTCHRTIDDGRFHFGGLESGPSEETRRHFVMSRHVDTQEPCRSCWARYLCGGGCHAEVLSWGRSGCDYIRGWLEYCISLYPEVLNRTPDLLSPAGAGNLPFTGAR